MTLLYGVVHLLPLPGSPRWGGSLQAVLDAALADAQALADGGADGIVIENFHDAPFRPERVDAVTVAAMTRAALAIRAQVALPQMINVLRNDAAAALGIAVAVGAEAIRINVHTGVMVTDQGLLRGNADETLRLRRLLSAEQVQIVADVLVKHAVPLSTALLEDAVHDVVERGLADAVIVTGSATGQATDADDVKRAHAAAQGRPVWVGSGVTPEHAAALAPYTHGVIVGTWLKQNGDVHAAVDARRVRQLRSALDAASSTRGSR